MNRPAKSLVICHSISHGNTRKIADVMASVLEAAVVAPDDVDMADLEAFDLIGFGSGVRYNKMYPDVLELVKRLPQSRGKAFVYATSGFSDGGFQKFSRPLVQALEGRGFDVVGNFSCRAYDTSTPLKLVGGIRKGRPNADDLAEARAFAEGLRARVGS